jgi:hypothetical protein
MTDIVGIIGPSGEGGTFLDWSLHYLIGNKHVRLVNVDRIKNSIHGSFKYRVPDNPITVMGNAHNHKKTHPNESVTQIQGCVDLLRVIDDEDIKLYTLYIVPSSKAYAEFHTYQNFVKHAIASFTNLKFIQLYHSPEVIEDLVNRICTKTCSFEEQRRSQKDTNEPLEDIISRVTLACNNTNIIETDTNVYSLSIKDMFYNLDSEIHNILSWLSLTIDSDKYENWLVVYKEWQQAQNFKGIQK